MEYYEEELETTQHPKDKHKWSKQDIAILLKYYEDFMSNSVFTKRKLLWITLAKQLQANRIPVDPVQCENKWKALCRAYRNQYKSFQYREIVERILSLNDNSTVSYMDNKKVAGDEQSEPIAKKLLLESEQASYEYLSNANHTNQSNTTKIWTETEVNTLLEVFELNGIELMKLSKKRMYDTLAQYLQVRGLNVSALNVEHKWKGLLRAFKRRKSQNHEITSIDLRVEKLCKSFFQHSTSDDVLETTQKSNSSNEMGGLTHINYEYEDLETMDHVPSSSLNHNDNSNQVFSLLNTEDVASFPIEANEYEEVLDDNLSMHTMSGTGTDIEISEETFEERLLRFLKEQEEAKQRRHAEKMELKRKKLDLLEALVQAKK